MRSLRNRITCIEWSYIGNDDDKKKQHMKDIQHEFEKIGKCTFDICDDVNWTYIDIRPAKGISLDDYFELVIKFNDYPECICTFGDGEYAYDKEDILKDDMKQYQNIKRKTKGRK